MLFNSILSTVAYLLLLVLILKFYLSHLNKSKKSLRLRAVDLVYDKYFEKISGVFYKYEEKSQKNLNEIYSGMIKELKHFEISKEDLNNYIIFNKSTIKKDKILSFSTLATIIPYLVKKLSENNLDTLVRDLALGVYIPEIRIILMLIIIPLVFYICVIISFREKLIQWNQKLPVIEDLYNYWDNVDLKKDKSEYGNNELNNDKSEHGKNELNNYKANDSSNIKLKDIFKFICILFFIFLLVCLICFILAYLFYKHAEISIIIEILLLSLFIFVIE